ncbi:hypothetical protein U3516DRAFT_750127 [Neocallimastix sp. 'constans']
MPAAAFAAVGLYFGILNILVFGCGVLLGLWLLTRCATYTGRNSSFFSLSMITFPQASIFFDLAISIKCFGVSVYYLIVVDDLEMKYKRIPKKFPISDSIIFEILKAFYWTTKINEHFYVIKMKTAAECAQILGCNNHLYIFISVFEQENDNLDG